MQNRAVRPGPWRPGPALRSPRSRSEALDAGLIAAQQAVKSWAQELGLQEAIPLLAQTLEEETKTDRILTQLAESRVNEQAAAVVAE